MHGAAGTVEEHPCIGRAAHDRSAGWRDLGRTQMVVARRAPRRKLPQRLAQRGRSVGCGGWRRFESGAGRQAHQEHSLTSLRHAVVGGVEHQQVRLVPQLVRLGPQGIEQRRPPPVGGQRLHVLHHESAGRHQLHGVHEAPHVPRPRVGRVHLPCHREPLARRPADHQIGTQFPEFAEMVVHVACDAPVLMAAQVRQLIRQPLVSGAVGRGGCGVDVYGEQRPEPGIGEAHVEAARTAVQRRERLGRDCHAALLRPNAVTADVDALAVRAPP